MHVTKNRSGAKGFKNPSRGSMGKLNTDESSTGIKGKKRKNAIRKGEGNEARSGNPGREDPRSPEGIRPEHATYTSQRLKNQKKEGWIERQ